MTEAIVYAAIVIAGLAALWVLLPWVGSRYADRRVHRALAPGERLMFKTRCQRARKVLWFWWLGNGTIYVTDRRLIWKSDRGLWPTQFEPVPVFNVTDASVKKRFWFAELRITIGAETWSLMPLRFYPFSFAINTTQIAEELRDHILNHPERQAVLNP